MYLYIYCCFSAGVVDGRPSCFVIILLHHAPPKVASVVVIFFLSMEFILVYVSLGRPK